MRAERMKDFFFRLPNPFWIWSSVLTFPKAILSVRTISCMSTSVNSFKEKDTFNEHIFCCHCNKTAQALGYVLWFKVVWQPSSIAWSDLSVENSSSIEKFFHVVVLLKVAFLHLSRRVIVQRMGTECVSISLILCHWNYTGNS